jgi:hypothetical protein
MQWMKTEANEVLPKRKDRILEWLNFNKKLITVQELSSDLFLVKTAEWMLLRIVMQKERFLSTGSFLPKALDRI